MLDLEFMRRAFPALDGTWAHLDNAGGTLLPQVVIDRITTAMQRATIARGGPHARSHEATEINTQAHEAAAEWIGADPDEVVLSSSSTTALDLLARSLRPHWREGDEVIVTALDHAANIGPWRRLQAGGITIREWPLRRESASLEIDDLRQLLCSRTRLVAFTHCANVVGSIVDVAEICRLIHSVGALACVDGVAYAPHRQVDVHALGVDFYAVSLYKIFGPHLGLLYGKREHLRGGSPPAHDFLAGDHRVDRYEPGGVSPELCAGVPGILDHFDALDHHTFAIRGDADVAPRGRLFQAIAEHEAMLTEILLSALRASKRTRIIGPTTSDPDRRIALVSFQIPGTSSPTIAAALARCDIAVRSGHFYAPRALEQLGLDPSCEGLVRISLAHYNSVAELNHLVRVLMPFLD